MQGKQGLPAPALITHRWLMLDLGSDAVPPIRHFLLCTQIHKHKSLSGNITPRLRFPLGQANVSEVSWDGDEI